MKSIKLISGDTYDEDLKMINEVVYPMTEFEEIFVKFESKTSNFMTTYICRRDENNEFHIYFVDGFFAED